MREGGNNIPAATNKIANDHNRPMHRKTSSETHQHSNLLRHLLQAVLSPHPLVIK